MRKVFLLYLGLLTLLLLVRNPYALVRTRFELLSAAWLVQALAHFGCFAVLAVLALATRPRMRASWLLALLGVYALATELLQGFVPPRTPEFSDFVLNILGIAAGTLCWAAWRRRLARRAT